MIKIMLPGLPGLSFDNQKFGKWYQVHDQKQLGPPYPYLKDRSIRWPTYEGVAYQKRMCLSRTKNEDETPKADQAAHTYLRGV